MITISTNNFKAFLQLCGGFTTRLRYARRVNSMAGRFFDLVPSQAFVLLSSF